MQIDLKLPPRIRSTDFDHRNSTPDARSHSFSAINELDQSSPAGTVSSIFLRNLTRSSVTLSPCASNMIFFQRMKIEDGSPLGCPGQTMLLLPDEPSLKLPYPDLFEVKFHFEGIFSLLSLKFDLIAPQRMLLYLRLE